MSSNLLSTYTYVSNKYAPIPGTDDWTEVATLSGGSGYDWADFNAFYSPSARRYFWHGDRGCSCNSWTDGLSSAADFENGDRAALLRAWKAFVEDNESAFGVSDHIDGVTTINGFKEN